MTNAMMLSDENPADVLKQNKNILQIFVLGIFMFMQKVQLYLSIYRMKSVVTCSIAS